MRQAERFVTYTALAACIGAGIATGVSANRAAASAPTPIMVEPARIASVDVLGIVARFLESDRYKPANIANAEKYDTKLKALIGELSIIEKQGAGLTQQSPEFPALQQQFQAKQREFDQARGDAQAAVEQFNTDQITESYRLTIEAANSLATQLGYSHVVVSRAGGAKINSNNVAGAVQEIIARPLIMSDPADDLTERLIKQFGLESVVIEPAAPDAAAPAPGAGGGTPPAATEPTTPK